MARDLTRGETEPYILAPHLELISNALVRAAVGEIPRLIVEAPPRHGKSLTVSQWFPVWYLTLWPNRRVIIASHTADLAREGGRKIRNTIARYQGDQNDPLLGLAMAEDSSAAGKWHTKDGGGLFAVGIGSAVAGWGAHLLVIDDPYGTVDDAQSKVYRDKVWEWYISDAHKRLEPGAAVVTVQTRWHMDDLVGRLILDMERGGETWERLTLRAIAEEDDPLGRPIGAPLWPERYSLDDLRRIRTVGRAGESGGGSRAWEALYQQRPAPAEGALVNRAWWRYYDVAPDPELMDQVVQSWDLTFGASATSDFVAGHVWGRKGASYYLLDRIHERLDAPGQIAAIRTLTERWPMATGKLIEKAANGEAIVALLQYEVSGLIPVQARGSKEHRLAYATNAAAPLIEAGNVYLPRNQPWARDVVEEFASFPNGAHDDDVDAATQALAYLARYGRQESAMDQRTALKEGPPPRTTQEWTIRQRRLAIERAEKAAKRPGNSWLRRR